MGGRTLRALKSTPETHYAVSGELQIAYQAFGEGPELVWVPGWVSQLDLYWEEPALARFFGGSPPSPA